MNKGRNEHRHYASEVIYCSDNYHTVKLNDFIRALLDHLGVEIKVNNAIAFSKKEEK